MRRMLSWLYSNSVLLLVGAASFVVGVAVTYPLGWKLPDVISSLFGSVAGSVGAVGGAFLLWKGQETRAAHQIAEAIRRYCQPFQAQLVDLAWAFEPNNVDDFFEAYSDSALRQLELLKTRLKRLEPQLLLLAATQLDAYLDLEIEIDVVLDEITGQRARWAAGLEAFELDRRRGTERLGGRAENIESILQRITPS